MPTLIEDLLPTAELQRVQGRALLALVAKAEWEGTLTSLEAQEAAGQFARWVLQEGDPALVPGPELPHHLVMADVVSLTGEGLQVLRRGISWTVPWGVVRVPWRHADDHFVP